jgi:hypothetical protein
LLPLAHGLAIGFEKAAGDLGASVYWHLTTSSHSTMIGVYVLPIPYLVYETGSTFEGASKGLRRVCEVGIASYDEVNEIVWVHDMAANQIAPRLSPKDKKVLGVCKQLQMLPICQITLGFYGRYRDAFHLAGEPILEEYERAFEAPSEPLRSKDKDKEQDLGEGKGSFGLGAEKNNTGQQMQIPAGPEAPASSIPPKPNSYLSAKHGVSIGRDPFPAPRNEAEGKEFLRGRRVPESEWVKLLPLLMSGDLLPFDIEPWENAA